MNIVVTGASGFVGGHLCAHLISRGHVVSAVVRRAGTAPAGTREVVVDDIGPTTDWDGLLTGEDAVIHLAARVHVMSDTSTDPLAEFRRVNTKGTNQLLAAAIAQGVGRFVYLSSIKVNGEETSAHPFDALSTPRPVDPYGVSKYEAEIDIWSQSRGTSTGAVVIRTPLVYGPGVGGNFIRMLGLARHNLPLPFASVSNRRSVISVWNLVDLLERAAGDDAAAGALMIAGDPTNPSTAELFRAMSAAMGKPNRLFPFPVWLIELAGKLTGKSGEVSRLVRSLEVVPGSASNDWVWLPAITFDEGIGRTVQWFKEK